MAVKPDMIGIVTKDMAKALAFYRLVGLDIPEPEAGNPHADPDGNIVDLFAPLVD